ncbi:MAG: PorT family protein [Bacteroidetes bacterium]|nr:PorT family protein [Bacteroidota bacterium]
MKKVFLPIIIFCSLFEVSFAQLEAGIKAGGNFSNITTSGSTTNHFIPGYHGGLMARYHLNKYISLQTEALYSTKGFKYDYKFESSASFFFFTYTATSEGSGQYNFSYIDVPLIANGHFGGGGNSYVGLGPQLSFLVSSNHTGENTVTAPNQYGQQTTTTTTVSETPAINSIDFGAVISVGTKIGGEVDCSLRAAYGFSDASDSNKNSNTSGSNHNLVFSLSAAYMFGLSKTSSPKLSR